MASYQLTLSAGYRFEIRTGKADPSTLAQAKKGTKSSRGANFVCVLTDTPITPDYIMTQGRARRMGNRLMAVVAEGKRGRVYLSPDEEHGRIAASAEPTWGPDQEMTANSRYLTPTIFGFRSFADLFTPRQLAALTTFSDLVMEARRKVLDHATAAGLNPDQTPLAGGVKASADMRMR